MRRQRPTRKAVELASPRLEDQSSRPVGGSARWRGIIQCSMIVQHAAGLSGGKPCSTGTTIKKYCWDAAGVYNPVTRRNRTGNRVDWARRYKPATPQVYRDSPRPPSSPTWSALPGYQQLMRSFASVHFPCGFTPGRSPENIVALTGRGFSSRPEVCVL